MSKAMFKYAIREAQSKAKQKEFGIEKSEYPHFITDSDDLDYQCILSIIEYAQNYLDETVDENMRENLELSATYFDSAMHYDEKQQYSDEYLLLGASAFFFVRNFGNSVTLLKHAIKNQVSLPCERRLAYLLANLLSTGVGTLELEIGDFYSGVDLFVSGEDSSKLESLCKEIDDKSIRQGLQLDSLFNIITRAVVKMSSNFLTSKLLPKFSGIEFDRIMTYLNTSEMPVMLWPSQIEIGQAGGYAGNNLIIQAPTGSGKTKSIEFIIATAFAANKAKNAIVVAPLRSLVEEISDSMKGSFKNVAVNSVSDILQENDFLLGDNNNILVLTPEKLEYIIFHNSSVINAIDLFVFDEGHMIDDDHRGASFELLLTYIKNNVDYKQMIFISAVIPNGNQIGEWLYRGHAYKSISHKDIPSTSKHIAVLRKKNTLEFYKLTDFSKSDYFVQNSIKTRNIPTKSGRRSVYDFPEKRIDYALYYADLLIPNGSLAVYFGSRRRIDDCLKRINYLSERKFTLDKIARSVNEDQLNKLLNLIDVHYGQGDYYNAAKSGVLVHYADLEEGLKTTAEAYLKRQYLKLILCTSTLSEGVNLPIKYLLMTETKNYMYDVSTRTRINLIGRAARSGHYTEGTIIVTEKDNRPSDLEAKFADNHSENCTSCLYDLVNEEYYFTVEGTTISSFNIYKHILDAIQNEDYFLYAYQEKTLRKLREYDYGHNAWAKEQFINRFINLMEKCRSTIEAILVFLQNIVCASEGLDKERIRSIFELNLNETYGFFLLSEEHKPKYCNLMNVLYDAIYDEALEIVKNNKYIPTGKITEIKKIVDWNDKNKCLLKLDEASYIEGLGQLYYEINPNDKVSSEKFIQILKAWIAGSTFINIATEVEIAVIKVEKICKKELSYGLSMYFGHLIDLTDDNDDIQKLQLIQKRVKYGLPIEEQINLYESGITDRFICQKLLDDSYLSHHGGDKESFLEQYPDWIKYRYNDLSKQ